MMRYVAVFFAILGAGELWAQDSLRAYLDRETVYEGETVGLTIEVADQMPETNPELTPLEGDFQIISQSTGTELRVIDGSQQATTRWSIELMPKRTGRLGIPALRVGAASTEPLELEVLTQAPAAHDGGGRDFFLEQDVTPRQPYVQAQVRYTLRLFFAVRLLEGNLEPPRSADVTLESLGKDVVYSTLRHGRRYQVIERRYALFPQKSGRLELSPAVFEGRLADESRHRSLTDQFFSRGRRARLTAKPVTLHVMPRPAGYSGTHWLPAEEVSLREAWSQEPPKFTVGEPITRRLLLQAKGLSALQLPQLEMPAVAQLRVYPDQPIPETQADNAGVTGRLEQRIALIPGKAGELLLPEMRLSWWDTRAQRQREAVLPARTVTVLPGAAQAASLSHRPMSERSSAEPQAPGSASMTVTGKSTAAPATFWPWFSGALMLLWVLTVGAWWRERHTGQEPSDSARQAPPVSGPARQALQRACRSNDAPAAARALLAWAALIWPESPPHNLGALAERLRHDAEPVHELDRALYGPGALPWQGGEKLWARVRKVSGRRKNTPAPADDDLPPLFPERA